MGAQSILGGRRGFINFPRELLVSRLWRLLPKTSVVIEVLESVELDDEVLEACREMHEAGYRMALDDYYVRERDEELLQIADYVKIDLQATTPRKCRELAQDFTRRRLRIIAEKVETRKEFEFARSLGIHLFQGYFFTRPVIVSGRDVPGIKLNYLRLLQELQSSDLQMDRVEKLIRHELSLAHKLLRYVNSAAFGFRAPIQTVWQAIVAIGEFQMRRWLLLTVLPNLAQDRPNELVSASLARARFCERLPAVTGNPSRSQDLFMMGLFSLLDSILNRPLETLVQELNLPEASRLALLGKAPESYSGQVYSLVCACETADWEAVKKWSAALNVREEVVSAVYAEALAWSDQSMIEIGLK
jgi:EAL and modified HD-GYP domain-containing signal transduction protein